MPSRSSVALLAFAVVVSVGLVAGAQTKLSADCQGGNQKACAELARVGTTLEVRLAAVRKINDQDLLDQIARTDKDGRVRVEAIRALIDQDALLRIARENAGAIDRGAAVDRLLREPLLADIARKDASKWVRRKAASRLTDAGQIARLLAENRHELLPTLTIGAGLKHVTLDGKEVKETLIGIATIGPGHHTVSADFTVRENVTWEANSVTSTEMNARLGVDYSLEAEVGIVHWDYLAPGTRRGQGTWKLIVKEEISAGPDLFPFHWRP